MVIVDTSVIIEHLRLLGKNAPSNRSVLSTLRHHSLFISVISIQELYSGKSLDNEASSQNLQFVLKDFVVLDYSLDIAMKAGELVRQAPVVMTFADAAIAATALKRGMKLVTLNRKDFEWMEGLELVELVF